jgi:hypothetical protein
MIMQEIRRIQRKPSVQEGLLTKEPPLPKGQPRERGRTLKGDLRRASKPGRPGGRARQSRAGFKAWSSRGEKSAQGLLEEALPHVSSLGFENVAMLSC